MAKTPQKPGRRRAEKLPAATSQAEAIGLLQRYAALDAEVVARDARVAAAIAQLRAEADKLNEPAIAEQKAIFLAVKPWWAVEGDAITDGKRKSWELGGCLIGHRTANPSLDFPKPEGTAVKMLAGIGFNGLLRIKIELDKPAIMAAIRWTQAPANFEDDTGEAIDVVFARRWFAETGFTIKQAEEFFIDRLPPKGSDTDVVADPAAAQAARVAVAS